MMNLEKNGFFEIPKGIQTWFLDTCVWSEILSSRQYFDNFVAHFHGNNHLAGLTTYIMFELSRAEKYLSALDDLFYKMRPHIWIALFYDELFECELTSYPIKPVMRWMTILRLIENDDLPIGFISLLASNPDFINSRTDHLDFGNFKFLSLEEFKINFPLAEISNYSTDQAYNFSRVNAIDYFVRHEPHVLKRIGVREFLPEGIPSLYARSLFLFYKYYVHGQSPTKSDFMDFAHISYAPYFNVYVTEKNVSNVLKHIKSKNMYFQDVEIMNLRQFLDIINQ